MNWLHQKLTDVIGLDPRSLAVLRIGLGLTLLLDLGVRAMDVAAMYAGDGIMPIDASIKAAGPMGWSLHWISGEPWFQWLLLGTGFLFAVGVVAGWQTRWMLLASFVLLASIQTRNQAILNGGDGMFRVMLFWSIFLPLGSVWSLDARRRTRRGHPPSLKPVVSVATFCFILQLCLVYWFAGTAKLNDVWLGFDPDAVWSDPASLSSATFGGEAMQHAMHYDIYSKPAATLLRDASGFLRLVCIGTLVLEIFGPCLLFIPFGTRWIRMLIVASFALLHIGIELTLHVGMFSWVSLAAWAALLPPMFWESRLFSRLGRPSKMLELTVPPNDSATWGWTKFVIGNVIPAAICTFLMTVTLAWNFSYNFSNKREAGIDGISPRERIQKPLRPIVNSTMLRQRWNMFSRTITCEKWMVFRAELANGDAVDIYRGGAPAVMEKPANLSGTYPNHRWRKLNVLLCSTKWRWQRYRRPVAEYLCRQWNATHGPEEQVVRCQIYQLKERKDDQGLCSKSLCLTVIPEGDKGAPGEDSAGTSDSEIAATSP